MSVIQTKTVKTGNGNKTFTANVEIFDSTMEVVEKCKTRSRTNSKFHEMVEYVADGDEDWFGVDTYDKALELMYDGWNEKVKELQATIGKLKATHNDKRITFQNDVHGFSPIVPLAILGVPNAMINATMKPIKSKVVSVYYDMSVHCGNSAEQIMENGRKVVEAIVKLENCGYRVNLYSVQTYNDDNKGDILAVKVKSANQPLDLKRICFPIMHAAFFRVIGFDWYGKFPKGTYRSGYGYSLQRCVGKEYAHNTMRNIFGQEAIYLLADSVKEHDTEYIVKELKGEKK